jgi:ribose 5-phosphate isomerase A
MRSKRQCISTFEPATSDGTKNVTIIFISFNRFGSGRVGSVAYTSAIVLEPTFSRFVQPPIIAYPRGMDAKQRAGEAALGQVKDGMIVGLGTGSTAKYFIEAVATAVRAGKLRGIRAVPTSVNSEKLARDAGLPVVTFAQTTKIDLTVDGADEVAPDLTLIKGLGGALLREKLVAQNSLKFVVIADASKLVTKLGTKSPLPVEVTPFGFEASERFLRDLACTPTLRRKTNGEIFITDNGNYIFDCNFTEIADPRELNQKLAARAGIVESGLFIDLAHTAIIADNQTVWTIAKP